MVIDETLYIPINSCPICGSKDSKVIRTETNDFYGKNEIEKIFFIPYEKDSVFMQLCQSCDFAYIDRLPKEAIFYEKLYGQINYDYAYEFKYHGKKQIHQDIKCQLKKYCPSGSLLDIGTWCGTLLESLADTYSVIGCELSHTAANYGRSVGLDIRIGSFEAVGFSPESFDVITIIDVLEHLPNPNDVLKKIHHLLKDGGILYIKVPNGKAQIKKQTLLQFLKLSHQGVGINFVHINHFSHQSLQQALESLGFEMMEKGYTKAEIWDLSYPQPINQKFKKWTNNLLRNWGTSIASFISYISPIDMGLNIYVIAKKSGTPEKTVTIE
jgi:SAM-dependent methyltransferase